jgi:cAMP-dependent protein kinase regulator
MYFIESGTVKIYIENDEEKESEFRRVELRKLTAGAYFGEIGLINKAPRSASAYVDDENICKLAFLDIDAFERLMGSCIELFKSKIKHYK